ncbi:hypothetical protein Pmani_017436 [Petrolisthes manimaculis]|uniref:TGF-beta family profile domain-containing protein n=1 Tax=Petrolisthes manimaculis TaxID=1843537 RepID=A0AAE1PND6_9EUCA|nr:hypothetical protein Pmani_017436 [Petrolisthes manimaculis]
MVFIVVVIILVVMIQHLAGSNHARLQALLHSLLPVGGVGGVGGNGGVPSPCCVPQGLDGVTILMVDEMDRWPMRKKWLAVHILRLPNFRSGVVLRINLHFME